MSKRAEKHLEIALGGDMNISTLKPLALIEIMTDFAKKEIEAINDTRCCTELKDKKDDNFEGYTIVDIKGGQIILHKGEIYTSEFINEYNKMK